MKMRRNDLFIVNFNHDSSVSNIQANEQFSLDFCNPILESWKIEKYEIAFNNQNRNICNLTHDISKVFQQKTAVRRLNEIKSALMSKSVSSIN